MASGYTTLWVKEGMGDNDAPFFARVGGKDIFYTIRTEGNTEADSKNSEKLEERRDFKSLSMLVTLPTSSIEKFGSRSELQEALPHRGMKPASGFRGVYRRECC